MLKIYLYIALTLSFISSCDTSRTAVSGSTSSEVWNDTPGTKTTRMKVVTSLKGVELKQRCMDLVVQHRIKLDTSESGYSTWYSLESDYRDRLKIQFEDSVLVLSAEYKRNGMGGSYWDPLPLSSEWVLSWKYAENISQGFPGMSVKYNDVK